MARFRNQVSKGLEGKPETKNQKPENGNQKPKNEKEPQDVSELYGESDMELVNVAGFKVPYVVREHWKSECRKKRVKLSPMLKKFLVGEFGLPPGFKLDDL